MTKPVRMTHTQASMVLSNWVWIGGRPEHSKHAVYLGELGVCLLFWSRVMNGPLSPDAVAICIEVVERRRRK
jgi:hypothetical protein